MSSAKLCGTGCFSSMNNQNELFQKQRQNNFEDQTFFLRVLKSNGNKSELKMHCEFFLDILLVFVRNTMPLQIRYLHHEQGLSFGAPSKP